MKPLLVSILAMAMVAAPAMAGPFSALGGDRPERHQAVTPPTDLRLHGTIEDVRRRADAVMAASDFEPTESVKAGPNAVGYTRLVGLPEFRDAADCAGLGVGNPKLWIETVVIKLGPGADGVDVTVRGEFKVVLSGLVSGKPFTLACKSRGVLESQLVDKLRAG